MVEWTAQLDTDFKESLTLKDSDGVVFDLTGFTTTFEVRSTPSAQGTLLIGPSAVTVVSAVDGEVDVDLTDTQINALKLGSFYVDLKIVRDLDSFIYRTVTAKLIVSSRVTA